MSLLIGIVVFLLISYRLVDLDSPHWTVKKKIQTTFAWLPVALFMIGLVCWIILYEALDSLIKMLENTND